MAERESQRKVLILDDSEDMLAFCRLAFESAGYRVTTRNHAVGAAAAILHGKPDIVLLQVSSTLAGDAIARVLARIAGTKMLILLHSSMSIDALRLKSLGSGAHGYVQTTSRPTELVRRVEEWLLRSGASAGRISASMPLSPRGEARGSASMPMSSRGEARGSASMPLSSRGEARGSASMLASRLGTPDSGAMPIAQPSSRSSAPPARRTDSDPNGLRAARILLRGRPRSSALSGTIRVPLRVLFADPNPEMLDNWRRTIGEELAAEYVSRGDHALNAVLSDKRPEVIVANLVLSGTSGPELYRCTRAVDPVLAQRFIFVSDAPLTEEQAAFLNEFQVPVFHRPFPPKRLLHTILRGDSQRKTGR